VILLSNQFGIPASSKYSSYSTLCLLERPSNHIGSAHPQMSMRFSFMDIYGSHLFSRALVELVGSASHRWFDRNKSELVRIQFQQLAGRQSRFFSGCRDHVTKRRPSTSSSPLLLQKQLFSRQNDWIRQFPINSTRRLSNSIIRLCSLIRYPTLHRYNASQDLWKSRRQGCQDRQSCQIDPQGRRQEGSQEDP